MKKLSFIVLLALALVILQGCKKFLDEKSNKQLVVPENLQDLQSLLNNFNLFNNTDPSSGEISSDDYFINDAEFNALSSETDQRKYTWEKDHLFDSGERINDWSRQYSLVYVANGVLEQLENIKRTQANANSYDDLMGQAYFLRAKGYYNALSIWALGYNKNTASSLPGVVIRAGTDFNKPSVRSSIEQGYQYVLADMRKAVRLLTPTTVHPTRPAKQAGYGFMARILLSMGDFQPALNYADSCLKIKMELMDFNLLPTTKTYAFTRFNSEVIYESFAITPTLLTNTRARIDTTLYAGYANDDLRKTLYFRTNTNGTFGWRGSFIGGAAVYSALCIDEVLLIRAECYAHGGDNVRALADLNTLLIQRYKKGTFTPYTVANVNNVTGLILVERRKELLFRGLRWTDLKRLNILGQNIFLKRNLNGETYALVPNDPRYALEIPEDIIVISGIAQNNR